MKLTEEQLHHLMTDLELENVERTRAFDKADKMGQAICAFANDLSGRGTPSYLLLGVENDGKISGKRIDDEHLTSLGGLKTEGNLLPPPAMALDVFHFTEGDVVVLTVFPSAYPPIRYQGQVWIRIGARKALATDEDIHLLEERRQLNGRRFEELPCTTARMEDLDLEIFQTQYLPKAIQAEVIEEDSRPVQEQMATLRFYDRNTHAPTNLGVILFGKHPDMFIPSAYLQYVRFATADNGGDILTEHAYKGPLLRIISELNSFVKVGIASPHPIRVSVLQEKTISIYPDWSIRELLLNAIIHRDYQIGNAPIKFYDYNGHQLEISNPGGLYGQATADNFPYVNDYRNPLLAEAMKVMGYVNKFNRGIAKVKAEMEINGNPPPIFDVNKRTEFRVTLRPVSVSYNKEIIVVPNGEINGENGEINGGNGEINGGNGEINGEINGGNGEINGGINGGNGEINDGINGGNGGTNVKNGEIKIVHAIENHPGIKREGLLLETKIPLRTIDRFLQHLKRESQIEYRGSRKTGGWFIKS
jgi:ATP-dependent DNA helicase RecG